MLKCATIEPLNIPHKRPAMTKAGNASHGALSGSEKVMPMTAATASMEPTERPDTGGEDALLLYHILM